MSALPQRLNAQRSSAASMATSWRPCWQHMLQYKQHVAAARHEEDEISNPGGAGAAAAAAVNAGRAAQQLQAEQAARYEQIRRQRGLAGPVAAGSGCAAGTQACPQLQLASV